MAKTKTVLILRELAAVLVCAAWVLLAGCDFDGGFTSSSKGTSVDFDSCVGDDCDKEAGEADNEEGKKE